MIYGYMRVSTIQQVKGNSLTEQKAVLVANGAQEIYQDAYTGTKISRPNFNLLLNKLQTGDTLIVAKLDRFARNTVEGISVVQQLLQRGVRVTILNIGTVDDTPTGKLILTVMLGFAEFERDMIIQRTGEGKEIARAKLDYREGRPPKYTGEELRWALDLCEEHTLKEVCRITKMSESTILRAKRKVRNGELL